MLGLGLATLHARVVRAAPALGAYPDDVLTWVFNVTGLAVNTVLGVDTKLGPVTRRYHGLALVV